MVNMIKEKALHFDDITIIPQYSNIKSRYSIDLSTKFTKNYNLNMPIISSPMDTITGEELMLLMAKIGGVGILHRFMSIEEQLNITCRVRSKYGEYLSWVGGEEKYSVLCAAIGATGDYKERAQELLRVGINVLLIDVAHGHHENVKLALEYLTSLKSRFKFDIIAGNVATYSGAVALQEWGADAIRVGIAGGSVCSTAASTGVHIPTLQSIMDVNEIEVPIIADGGVRNTSDLAKCIAAGANSVMLGSLFAACDEAAGRLIVSGRWPNEIKKKLYRGSASQGVKEDTTGNVSNIEGVAELVDLKGPANYIVERLTDGLRSSMSYVDAINIEEFQTKSIFRRI